MFSDGGRCRARSCDPLGVNGSSSPETAVSRDLKFGTGGQRAANKPGFADHLLTNEVLDAH
jgi:hypothetical protein